MFDTGGFQLGDWVIIHSYNDYQNGQEGEIVEMEYSKAWFMEITNKIKELKPC